MGRGREGWVGEGREGELFLIFFSKVPGLHPYHPGWTGCYEVSTYVSSSASCPVD